MKEKRKMKLKLLTIRESQGETINSHTEVLRLMGEEALCDRECFWVLHLNTKNRLIEKELVSMGIVDTAVVHPREVFKKAIILSAKTIITVHNHPAGGELKPSPEDIVVWERLTKAGEVIGIEVLDHIIIGPGGDIYSHKA